MTLAMLPGMTNAMTPHALAGWIVREGIIAEGMTYTDASRTWGISLPTLNRVMNGVAVSPRFYALIERRLGLPRRFLVQVIARDLDAIRAADVDRTLRDFVMRELETDEPPKSGRSGRRSRTQ